MNSPTSWRDRRTFSAQYHPCVNYSADSKNNMKKTFADEMFLNNFHLSSDALRKNLADTIITAEKMAPKRGKMKLEKETHVEQKVPVHEDSSALSGIANFISGVVYGISRVVFTKREPAELSLEEAHESAPPSMWQAAKVPDENKTQDEIFSNDMSSEFLPSEMSDCRSAAAHCQNKLDQVRLLLGLNKAQHSQCLLRQRKRPKNVFVGPTSVEECFEDAFSPEDFENLANKSIIEYSSPVCYHENPFQDVDGPKMKLEAPRQEPNMLNMASNTAEQFHSEQMVSENGENTNVNIELPEVPPQELADKIIENVNDVPELNKTVNKLDSEAKKEIVESCEDKITQLTLFQEKKRKVKAEDPLVLTPPPVDLPVSDSPVSTLKLESEPLKTLPLRSKPSTKVNDKPYKNPNQCCDKRRKTKMKKSIEEDLLFANEMNSQELFSSVESSPSTNYFDDHMKSVLQPKQETTFSKSEAKPVPKNDAFNEVSGCFQSGSVESDDSFQIVFHDSPRSHKSSDCESDDFDIVFEDSPDNCYTSNDVFGDSEDSTDSEGYDSDSDESDSSCNNFKLSASLSRSVSNLADDSLYIDFCEDEVDCANIQDLNICDSVAESDTDDNSDTGVNKGVLLNERKKLLKKNSPAKRVRFSPNPPKVHVMRVWLFAAKQTRVRYWQQFAVDRERFQRRIADVDMAVSWVLKPQHRSRVMFQRFMPWWNAQKRKEIADKKEKEVQEKFKEEERLRNEEAERQNSLLDKNQNDENTVQCISLSRGEECSEHENLENNNSLKTPTDAVDIKEANSSNLDRDRVREENGNDSLIKDIGVMYENTKNSNETVDEKLFTKEIVPVSDKKLNLRTGLVQMHPEYVTLNT